jgi:hypothetical protein
MKTWKLQKFGSDLLHDLRSRGLLPLAVVLVVAIVAAPMVISRMSSSDAAPAPKTTIKSAAKAAPEGQAAVVNYKPGVRNYRERLDQGNSKDPFIQQFTADQGGGGGSDETGGGTTGGSTGDGTVTITGTTKSKLYYFYYETDVRAGESGTELKRHNKIDPFTLLPSEQTPILVFLGVTAGGKQAVFSVSRQVLEVSGEGTCYPEPQSCELLGVPPGGGADMVYAVDNKTYRVEVTRIKFVKSTKPPD